MSKIYFDTLKERASVSGSERFHCGAICNDMLGLALQISSFPPDANNWILKYIPEDSYLHTTTPTRFVDSLRCWLYGFSGKLLWNGKERSVFEIALNTALRAGGDAVKLAARLHGQCEIHCFVEGKNRKWLADLIATGRKLNIFRAEMGWEGVIELLKKADNAPVVCSYSVCESFPERSLVPEYQGEEKDEAWERLSARLRWKKGMTALRTRAGRVELSPEDWSEFYFGESPLTGFDLKEEGGR